MTVEPVNVRFLRTSERRDFLRCHQKWWWNWREGLRSRANASDALWFGTGIHVALATWYCGPGAKRGPLPAETWDAFAADSIAAMKIDMAASEEMESMWIDARTLGVILMEKYVETYGRDEHKLILKPEMTFELQVPWPSDQKLYPPEDINPEELLVWYVGTMDGVWRHADTGLIWLDEHKTEKTPARGHLPLDPQAGSYWAVAPRFLQKLGLLSAKDKIAGIEYNFIRKALPDDRPKDAEGYATNKPVKADYVTALLGQPFDHPGNWTETELRKMKLADLEDNAAAYQIQVLGERSKIQPPPLFERVQVHRTAPERKTQLIRLQQEALSQQALIDGVLPVLKNPTRDCHWDCQFAEMCQLHEMGGNWEEYRRVVFRPEDPYADHRAGAGDTAGSKT